MSEQFSQTQALWTIGSIFLGAVITSLTTYVKDFGAVPDNHRR